MPLLERRLEVLSKVTLSRNLVFVPLVVAHDGRFARGKPSRWPPSSATSSDGGKDMPMVAPKKLSPKEVEGRYGSMKEKVEGRKQRLQRRKRPSKNKTAQGRRLERSALFKPIRNSRYDVIGLKCFMTEALF